ncbi:MAG: hypothetical protein WCG21_08445 [Eubacteriales bacterium]
MNTIIGPSCTLLKPLTRDRYYLFFMYVFAALLLLFCTPNSPLFPTQDWVDPNVYMDVGRALNTGRVLYRDVFDHKGPLFLMIFAVLAPVSKNSLLGLYFLQTACLGTSLVFLYRTGRLFLSNTASFLICIFFPVFLLTGSIFSDGGGSPEEILLPCFMGSLYYVAAAFIPAKEGGSAHSTLHPFWFHGLFWGIAVLTKLNLSIFFAIGSAMLLLRLLLKRDLRSFAGSLFRLLGGVLLAFTPCIIYWTATGSLQDCWEAYVQFNMRYAAFNASGNSLSKTAAVFMLLFVTNFAGIMCAALGLILLQLMKKLPLYAVLTVFLMFVSLLVVTFGTGNAYWYYCIPFVCFAGFGEIGIVIFAREAYTKMGAHSKSPAHPYISGTLVITAVAVITAVIILGNGFWRISAPFSPEKSGVEETCDVILATWAQKGAQDKPDILLYHSQENGYYSKLGTAPQFRYFYRPGIALDLMPEYMTAQESYVIKGLPDYVICVSGQQNADFGIDKLNDQYVPIGSFEKVTAKPYYDHGLSYIYLYQKK